MKVLFVILDGLGDRQYGEFDGKTPLEHARTPNMDALAASGITGLMYPFRPGISPSSDLAHFRLFGYPRRLFPGRGYLEALGEDLPVEDDKIVLRASFLRVEQGETGYMITAREIEGEKEAGEMAAGKIRNMKIGGVKCRFTYSGKRQGFLVMSGDVSPEVTDSDPLEIGSPIGKVEALDEAVNRAGAIAAAQAANKFMLASADALRGLPLNFLALKWAGRKTLINSFTETSSFRGAIVAENALYKGMAKALGMRYVPGASGPADESLKSGLKAAEQLFAEGIDFVHVHSKAPDHAGHTKNPVFKAKIIAELDSVMSAVKPAEDFVVVITGDHATPCSGPQVHSGEAVPVIMAGGRCGRDTVVEYGETACRHGSLGIIQARDILPLILDYTDRANYLGLRPYSYKTNARPNADRANPLKPA